MIKIYELSLDELISQTGFDAMIERYAAESSIDEMPPIKWNYDLYAAMQTTGMIKFVAVFKDKLFVGFAVAATFVVPHYSRLITTCESLFVDVEHRGDAGLKLIKHIESMAKKAGSVSVMLSAPYGGKMEKLLPALKYKQTNSIFFKAIHE